MMETPCQWCPWRIENHGKKTPWGFYRKANLRRLWNQIRGGGAKQSCHPTDPSHPDHIAAGAKPGSTPRECPGSVILVLREFQKAAALGHGTIDGEAIEHYLRQHRDGLTRQGLLYWLVSRYSFRDTPFFGEGKLPDVDVDDPAIGRLE